MEPEADDQDERERDLARCSGLADRQSLAEVVQPDARRDQERQTLPVGQPLEGGAAGELVDRGSPGTDERRARRVRIQRS